MESNSNHVCPVELAGGLDNRLRRWLQDPRKILSPYVREGMTVLDVGCGPGFFSIALAGLVGPSGKVFAADLQEGMLKKLQEKVRGSALEQRITCVLCGKDSINVTESVDFILTFYMVHEVPDKAGLFRQLKSVLRPGGTYLLVEPKLFHVSRAAWEATLACATANGWRVGAGPKLGQSWSAVLSHV